MKRLRLTFSVPISHHLAEQALVQLGQLENPCFKQCHCFSTLQKPINKRKLISITAAIVLTKNLKACLEHFLSPLLFFFKLLLLLNSRKISSKDMQKVIKVHFCLAHEAAPPLLKLSTCSYYSYQPYIWQVAAKAVHRSRNRIFSLRL